MPSRFCNDSSFQYLGSATFILLAAAAAGFFPFWASPLGLSNGAILTAIRPLCGDDHPVLFVACLAKDCSAI